MSKARALLWVHARAFWIEARRWQALINLAPVLIGVLAVAVWPDGFLSFLPWFFGVGLLLDLAHRTSANALRMELIPLTYVELTLVVVAAKVTVLSLMTVFLGLLVALGGSPPPDSIAFGYAIAWTVHYPPAYHESRLWRACCMFGIFATIAAAMAVAIPLVALPMLIWLAFEVDHRWNRDHNPPKDLSRRAGPGLNALPTRTRRAYTRPSDLPLRPIPTQADVWFWRSYRLVVIPTLRRSLLLAAVVPLVIWVQALATAHGLRMFWLFALPPLFALARVDVVSKRLFRSGMTSLPDSVLGATPDWRGFHTTLWIGLASLFGAVLLVACVAAIAHQVVTGAAVPTPYGVWVVLAFVFLAGYAATGLPRLDDRRHHAWSVALRAAMCTIPLLVAVYAWTHPDGDPMLVGGVAASAIVVTVGWTLLIHLMHLDGHPGFAAEIADTPIGVVATEPAA